MAGFERLTCPTPLASHDRILLGHGSGGRLSASLMQQLILPALGNDILSQLEDQAIVNLTDCEAPHAGQVAITTDSFVVRPIFFPGGDIGSLAIHGTVNDLAVGGAEPQFIAVALILEEGLPISDLERILGSLRDASNEAGVQVVTGDTKVVERGGCDGIFITTTGIGCVPAARSLSSHAARPGDHVILSGTIGDHGIAIMSVREGLEFETVLESDSASLVDLTRVMLTHCPTIRCMRDPTRGGLSSALNEIATASCVGMQLTESAIPVRSEVRGACEMLGLDPLYVANEGKLVAIVPAEDSDKLVATMRSHPLGTDATVIGQVVDDHQGMLTIKSVVGGERIIPMLSGEQLPRIC